MKTLSQDQMIAISAGGFRAWLTGAACGAGVFGAVVLLSSNPVTMTAGVYLGSIGAGSAIGACVGLLST